MDLAADGKPWPDARRFENGGFHRPSVLGFARSCAWLSMYVGLPWIYERIARLARGGGGDAGRGARRRGPDAARQHGRPGHLPDRGWKATRGAASELSQRTLCIARTIPPLDAIRISVGFFNTEGELRRFRDGVALVAENTPETIPHRPQIEVLRGGRGLGLGGRGGGRPSPAAAAGRGA